MSDVYDAATVTMLMSDFAVTDGLNKLQVVGGGLQVVGRDHKKGLTKSFALVVTMTFNPSTINEQYAFEAILENPDGTPAQMDGPKGTGTGGVMRFGQTLQVEEPNFRGAGVPRHALPPRTQMVLYFNTGLPLPAGRVLHWTARIDGESKPGWSLPFFVTAPPAAPVLG